VKRLRTFLINIPNLPTMIAFRIVRRATLRDPPRNEIVEGLREQANGQRPLDGAFCNRAATRFMDLCFGLN
jgi:hypothetical protein